MCAGTHRCEKGQLYSLYPMSCPTSALAAAAAAAFLKLLLSVCVCVGGMCLSASVNTCLPYAHMEVREQLPSIDSFHHGLRA